MTDLNIMSKEENTYSSKINELISQFKASVIHKAFKLYLDKNYKEAELMLLSEIPPDIMKNDLILNYFMGHIKLKLGELKNAIDFFCIATNDNESFYSIFTYGSKGLAYLLKKNEYNEAISHFEKVCAFSQNNFHVYNHLALCYKIIYDLKKDGKEIKFELSDKKTKNSKKESDKLSSSKSNNSSEIENSLNERQKNKGKLKTTRLTDNMNKIRIKYKEAFKEALNINANSYISLLNMGTYHVEEGEIDQAGKYYKRAEIINKQFNTKKDWKIYINLAYLAFKEKEYPLSMGYFEILFKSFENRVDLKVLKVYMLCLYYNKEWKKLENVTKKILKIDKKNKRALVYLITSLEKNKKNEDLFFLLKKVKEKMKKIKHNEIKEPSHQSESKSEKEIEEKFQTPLFKYNQLKQIIKKKLKKVNEDLRIEHQGITKCQNPDSIFGDLDIDNLSSFGFKRDFIEKIMVLQSKKKDSPEVLFNLGFIFYKEEEYLKSEEYFKKVLEINPEYKKNIINEYLGDIYMEQYDSAKKALLFYNKAHSVYFNNSMNENNISASNINNNTSYGHELLLLKIGLCHEILEDNESALRYYKLALKKNPDFVNAIFHMGCIYDKMNKSEEALTWLEIAYEKEKENVDYLQKYGDCLVKTSEENNILKGIIILERGIKFFTGNIDIISSLAKGYEKQGRLKEAIALLEKGKNNDEFFSNKPKIFQLAYYYEKNKELTKALEYFKKVLYLDKKNIDALLHIGYIYRSIKENVKAFKCFKQVLNLEKDNFSANYGLARLYQSLDNHDLEAINCYKKCILLNPESVKANLQLGLMYLKTKNFEESLECLKKLISLEPNNILGLVALGNVYLELKNYTEAKNYLESALNLDKNNIAANVALGDVYFGMKEIYEAMQKYFFVNRINDNIPQVHLNLGHCFFMSDKLDSAITQYIKAIKLVKNTRHDYYYFLGNALTSNCRFKDGVMAYQAAIKLKPSKLNYYYAIAKACYLGNLNYKGIKYLEKLLNLEKDKNINKGLLEAEKDYNFNEALFLLYKLHIKVPEPEYNKCLNIMKALIRNEPKNVHYLEILADLQEKIGNFLEAIKVYKQIITIEPNNSEAKKKLNILNINESVSEQEKKQSSSKKGKSWKDSSSVSGSESSENKKSNNSATESSKIKSNNKDSGINNTEKEDSKRKDLSSIESESRTKENISRNKKSENNIKSFNITSSKPSDNNNKESEPINKKINESSERSGNSEDEKE